ncbi:MAG TPA: chitobiase/beta-hexosaminidase C-terminal domain-containing protein, partial [Verrucomicrobiae bacterium]|nr:chitobiase/beta-hexosaminidase C-terminal domain-containing protein [Verrucomicrobiae bacterium]
SVPGTGVDATNGVVTFAPQNHMNRPACALAGGILYLSYGSYGDTDPYHGWVIGYNATNFARLTNYVFATTPNATVNAFGVNAGEGALWMGGDGPCVDANGNLYIEAGNGSFSAQTNGGDYGDTFVKLSTTNSGFAVADYFTPYNQASMAANDEDLGSGGPILLPDAVGSAAHPHLMIGAGKEGTLYLLDRDNLGKYILSSNPGATGDTQIAQEIKTVIGGVWGSPAYFNHEIFFQGAGDVLKGFGITNGVVTTSPISKSTTSFGSGYTTPSVSANGTSNGIVWVIQTDAYSGNGPAILHAYNATNLSQELYNSSQIPARDNPGGAVKYAVPVVADGKVFVRGEYSLSVYGTGRVLPPPLISPNGGVYTNSITITLSGATNGAAIYYTLDGSTPTTNSIFYTVPFTLTNSAAVNAIAVGTNGISSTLAIASFINSSSIGNGTGLAGAYYANHTAANPYTGSPTMVRTDAVVNFNWTTNPPAAGFNLTNYTVRWTGSIQPQFDETYTFYATADDGVRLWLNGRPLIDGWVNEAATTYSNTITLHAQQLYNIEMDYYQNTGSAVAELQWSSPSTPLSVVPQTQIYPFTNPPPSVVLSAPVTGATYSGTASVTMGAQADAPYNSIRQVDFYANNNPVGTVSDSPDAPLYTLTTTGLTPNPGGEGTNSNPVSATPVAATVFTTTSVQAQGADWTAAIWQPNGTGAPVAPVAGNNYACLFNGTTISNNSSNTRVRTPVVAGTLNFPGDSLTLNANTELRIKNSPTVLNFPGVGGKPGLILNGGMLNQGIDGTANITGNIQIISQSYNSAGGNNGGGGGVAPNPRSITISGNLSGSGDMIIMNCSTSAPEAISGVGNTFSGQWIVQCGWLQGVTPNSLGTNSIIVDPLYTGYLATMPNATSPNGPALLEVNYDLTSSGSLTLAHGGLMNLHQNCAFTGVTINGVSLAGGTYSYAQLVSQFPNNFLPGGSGSITVNPVANAGLGTNSAPTGLSAIAGNALVNLSWNASPGATNYNVKRATASGGTYTTIASVAGTSFTDNGLANGTTYYYSVSAVYSPGYVLRAVVTDGSGLSSTSAPVQIFVNPGSGLPYGLTTNGGTPPYLNMPEVVPAILPGSLPAALSGTGAFSDTADRVAASGLIPYAPNTPLWSDNAVKSRYLALPNDGGVMTPDEQIAFVPTNSWTFPAGTVFVKNFDLVVNETNTDIPPRRLETRLLVRDINGQVYGVTYKWRADNSDADLLTTSLNEDILITNAVGVRTQSWYYPSPADCLTCHTPVANYVLGVSTRQLNGNLTYAATGHTDNQLRTLNRLGLFNPAINEADIASYAQMASLTNLSAPVEQRARSYLDANCAQCHQPGGVGITFDARYDTPLANQSLTNYPAQFSLGFDNACIIKPQDVWRSIIWQRMNTTNAATKMPNLARNLIDTNAVAVMAAWINSLPGVPALAPPGITPAGGTFNGAVSVTLQPPDNNAAIYYTLNGTLPTTNSLLYSGPLLVGTNTTLLASAFETNFDNSVAASALFTIQAPFFTTEAFTSGGVFQLGLSGAAGNRYVLQASTNLVDWAPIATNMATTNLFNLMDSNAAGFPSRFYRVLQQ